uniref:Uncharacterized protein n=1 Tax=Fundulus heteroclitus TaxID=8078 RepID=A0A3Q2R4R9_FUNHE
MSLSPEGSSTSTSVCIIFWIFTAYTSVEVCSPAALPLSAPTGLHHFGRAPSKAAAPPHRILRWLILSGWILLHLAVCLISRRTIWGRPRSGCWRVSLHKCPSDIMN